MIGYPLGPGGKGNLFGLFLRSRSKWESHHPVIRPPLHRAIVREERTMAWLHIFSRPLSGRLNVRFISREGTLKSFRKKL